MRTRFAVLLLLLIASPAALASEIGCPGRIAVPSATATFYDPIGPNACGLPIEPGEFVAAVAEPDWAGSALCGRCARVTGPLGSVVVRITDQCPSEGNPLCVSGHLDLSRSAFLQIGLEEEGIIPTSWETVACDVPSEFSYAWDASSNPFYARLQLREHRYGIARVEAELASGWTDMTRQPWNAFELLSGTGFGSTFNLRVTDVHGAIVKTDEVPFTPGGESDAGEQLPVCPEPTALLGGLAALATLRLTRQ